uniref:Uncharacterized protein n=1 Tax=Peronospora matthiolae TaxID=2874970 RepID=A0AAV1T434_9STRA
MWSHSSSFFLHRVLGHAKRHQLATDGTHFCPTSRLHRLGVQTGHRSSSLSELTRAMLDGSHWMQQPLLAFILIIHADPIVLLSMHEPFRA